MRLLSWLFPVGTSGWRLGFIASLLPKSTASVSEPEVCTDWERACNMPSKRAAAQAGQSREMQGVLWDELLCLFAAAAAEPASPSLKHLLHPLLF